MSDDLQDGKQTGFSDLLSVNINIGDALQLQDFSPDRQRHYVKLIGYLNRRSVLVSHPMLDKKLLFVKEGQSFLVRGFSGTKTYEFNANVIGVCLTPYPYLHLSFPEQVGTTNMRNVLRIKLKLVCSVEIQGNSPQAQKVPSTIEDMSIFGARVRSKRELGKIGDGVKVSFRLPVNEEEEQLVTIPAIIRNVHIETSIDNSGEEIVVHHGLEFMQVEGNDRMVLQGYIYKTMAEG